MICFKTAIFFALICFPSFAMAKRWDPHDYARINQLQKDWAIDALSLVQIEPTDQILDFGSRDGSISKYIAKSAKSVIGVESNGSMLEYAQKHYSGGNLNFAALDLAQIRSLGSFDKVVSIAALHWTEDKPQALKALASAMKGNSQLILSVPAERDLVLMSAVEQLFKLERWKPYDNPRNNQKKYHMWSFRAAFEQLHESGFEVRHLSIKKWQHHLSRPSYEKFIRTIMPYIDQIPLDEQQQFLDELLNSLSQMGHKKGDDFLFETEIINAVAVLDKKQ